MMSDPWTLAQAFAEFASIGAAEIVQQLGAVRSAAAGLGEEYETPAAEGVRVGGEYSRGPWDSAAATVEAGANASQAARPMATESGLDALSSGPAANSIGAELAAAVTGVLETWRNSTDDLPGDDRTDGALSATAASGPTADSLDSQSELLRECVEINRSLLELAQGTGIKVDMPEPGWGT